MVEDTEIQGDSVVLMEGGIGTDEHEGTSILISLWIAIRKTVYWHMGYLLLGLETLDKKLARG